VLRIQENDVVIRDLCREATKAQRCLRILQNPQGVPKRRTFCSPDLEWDFSYISSGEEAKNVVQSSHYLVGIMSLASQGETERRCIVKTRRTGRCLLELRRNRQHCSKGSTVISLYGVDMASIMCPSRHPRGGRQSVSPSTLSNIASPHSSLV
jgi:hypothetical protein